VAGLAATVILAGLVIGGGTLMERRFRPD
jgi:hypothetical protein